MKDLSKLTIFDALELLRKKEISAVELTKYHLQQAATVGKELNAFITIAEEYALTQAAKQDELYANGSATGKLAGIPCTIKDVLMTKDLRTTAGSKMLEDFVAPYSATVVQKLEAEGAIIIGKTNCDPFAFGGSGENSGYGPVLNPHDRTRVPGGSSSGAAASLAAGIGLFAIGTDTGGSVRQPAALTGLVGFKPTYGRNSRYGLIAMASSFDTPGIFTKTVKEAAYVEEIMAGKDPMDFSSAEVASENYLAKIEDKFDYAKLRIAVPKEYFQQGIEPEVAQKVKQALDKIKELGADVEEISLPLLKYAIPVYYVLVPSEISSNMARYDGVRYGHRVADDYLQNLVQGRGDLMEDEVKRRVMIGTYALSAGYADKYYKIASQVRAKLSAEIEKLYEKFDIIVGPTSPSVAFKIGEKAEDPLAMYLADVYTVTANIVGAPAISINCGYDTQNLPIGLQIMTKKFNEQGLFNIANAWEQILAS